MAQPIKETPVLTGKDAKRFAAEMAKPKFYTNEELKAMQKAHEVFKKNGLFL